MGVCALANGQNRYGEDFGSMQSKEAVDKMISMSVIEDIKAEIQTLRGCSCSCSDGIIDDVEDIIDKHISGKENTDADSN